MSSGYVRNFFPDRRYGYLRDSLNGAEYFFHQTEFAGDPATIKPYVKVEFDVLPYANREGKPAVRAIHVTPTISSAAPTVAPALHVVPTEPNALTAARQTLATDKYQAVCPACGQSKAAHRVLSEPSNNGGGK